MAGWGAVFMVVAPDGSALPCHSARMLPGITFAVNATAVPFDLAMALGDSPVPVQANRIIRLNAEPWSGMITDGGPGERWQSPWCFGLF